MSEVCPICFAVDGDHAPWCENANNLPEFLNDLFNQDESSTNSDSRTTL